LLLLDQLIKFRRIPSVRNDVVHALESHDLSIRIHILEKIKFTDFASVLDGDDWKYICFHLSQTLGLIEGKEFYTKNQLSTYFPDIHPFLYRQKEIYTADDIKVLEQLKFVLMQKISSAKVSKKGDLVHFARKAGTTVVSPNFLYMQCNGFVADLIAERVAFFPPSFINQEHALPTWPTDTLPNQAGTDTQDEWIGAFKWDRKIYFVSPTSFTVTNLKAVTTMSYKNELLKQTVDQGNYALLKLNDEDLSNIKFLGYRDKRTHEMKWL